MPYVSGFLRVREGGGNIDNVLPGHGRASRSWLRH